ncbi:hypothetical protein [Massilia niabensis]|uniref:Uncharacterized protein n=1 Tax=Massilia niabensis TaxID=544910 RepID=A0ABW0LBU3_9BURK
MQCKKRFTDAQRLHAALAETDPGSIDLILVRPAGYLPAFRVLVRLHASRPLACAAARPAANRGPHQQDGAPAWRRCVPAPKKSTVPPV